MKAVEKAIVRGVPFVEIISTGKEKKADMIVIGDVKRGDIGHTSRQYALAHLCGSAGQASSAAPDAITWRR